MKNDTMNNTASDISEIVDNPSDNLRKFVQCTISD